MTCDAYPEQTQGDYVSAEKMRYYDNTVFQINPMNIGQDPRTTLMIKNIPNKYTIQDLSN